MDVFSVLRSNQQSPFRSSDEKRATSFSPYYSRIQYRPLHGNVLVTQLRVAMDEFENRDSESVDSSVRERYHEDRSRKKIEMMTGLLREGYGVGALLTAGMIKGIGFTSDLLRSVGGGRLSRSLVRRQRKWRKKEKDEKSESGRTVTEKIQSAVLESLASPILCNREGNTEPENEETVESLRFRKEGIHEDAVGEIEDTKHSITEEKIHEIEENKMNDPVVQENGESGPKAISSISLEEEMEAADSLDSMSERDISESELEAQSTDPDSQKDPSSRSDEIKEENNIESFAQVRKEEVDKESVMATVAMDKAREILDEIANFETETGESVDFGDFGAEAKSEFQSPSLSTTQPDNSSSLSLPIGETKPQPLPATTTSDLPAKSSPSPEEIQKEMETESQKRLRAKRTEKRERKVHRKPVNVEKPTKEELRNIRKAEENQLSTSSTSSSSYGLKGLDYIKAYAKESQDIISEKSSPYDENSSEESETSAYFAPPSILQEGNKMQGMGGGSSGSYSRWNEVDRLQKVREIGTVLWIGKGGTGGLGGNDGNGGNGGGGGRSNHGPNDRDWWLQVGVSMMIMTGLVFAVLVAITNHLEKQTEHKKTATATATTN